ncbi:unnamed protein product [Pleuronectes platessa]|uniref:Uncharacterized protein n=1 Tax=Pleuronectes platessa TaxID=8262 RepID=A0A9N7UXM1_PLEPL|nr:unnamed protein product [Pleuronectes platessa]
MDEGELMAEPRVGRLGLELRNVAASHAVASARLTRVAGGLHSFASPGWPSSRGQTSWCPGVGMITTPVLCMALVEFTQLRSLPCPLSSAACGWSECDVMAPVQLHELSCARLAGFTSTSLRTGASCVWMPPSPGHSSS